MKTILVQIVCCLLACLTASATVRYVDLNSPNPVAPYAAWSTAATTIQDAVDVAAPGDEIIVTNGVYATGGRPSGGSALTNRVTVEKAVHLHSVNGPKFTIIEGRQVPGTTNGYAAIRCVSLTGGASLSGFTLTNGATRDFVYPEIVYPGNDWYGGGVWCATTAAVVSNCVIIGNACNFGGGGAYGGTLRNCVLTGNRSPSDGGGAQGSALFNCRLVGNLGGGAGNATLNNCLVVSNSGWYGGGASYSTLSNCTVVANAADSAGGGVDSCIVRNSIVFDNTAPLSPNYYSLGEFSHSCTTPMATGANNIIADPLFVDAAAGDFRLQPISACVNAGTNAFAPAGLDLGGNVRIFEGTVDMGAFELQTPALPTPPYVVSPPVNLTAVAGQPASLSVFANGAAPLSYQWFFNGAEISGATLSTLEFSPVQTTDAGDYFATAQNVSGSTTSSIARLTVLVSGTHYVDAANTQPASPFTSWAAAATKIQDAIDVAAPGDEIVVTNGVYATGGRVVYGSFTNRVALTKPVHVRSVNGPEYTLIQGYQVPVTTNGPAAIRCAYLTNGAALSGFTLTNGASLGGLASSNDVYSQQMGGGIWCEDKYYFNTNDCLVTNCIIADSTAADSGGGAFRGTLRDCTLTRNFAINGGGAYMSALTDCRLSLNVAPLGGGAMEGNLERCIVASNTAAVGGGVIYSKLNRCTLTGNSAGAVQYFYTIYHGGWGGASDSGELSNCVLRCNSATKFGGGASASTLVNCTVIENSAGLVGGGIGGYSSNRLLNCIAYFNAAPSGANYNSTNTALASTCTSPQPLGGSGNLSFDPQLVDRGGGNLRLRANSPCINAGNNAFVVVGTDFDGRPRNAGGTVDIGAYEFQPNASGQFIGWLQNYGLAADGSADAADNDSDRMNNWQEWRADTIPTNAVSLLKLGEISSGAPGLNVAWQSVVTRSYFIERSTNLTAMPPFSLLATNIPGLSGTTSFTDTSAVGGGPFFYRVGVEP